MDLSKLFSRGADRNADEIAHDELAAALKSEACVLVDVREPHEFSAGHIAGAINMPLSRFDREPPAARQGGRAHLPLGRAIDGCAEPRTRRRPRQYPPLSPRRHGLDERRRRTCLIEACGRFDP